MTWFCYSEFTAFFEASTTALSKKALKDCGVYTIAWVRFGYAVPFLVCALMFIEIPPLDTTFFIMIAVLVPLEALGTVLYIRAIKFSPLSLTMPFLALTPAFLIITSYLMLGEQLSGSGIAGVFLVVAGAYLLNVHTTRKGLLEPLRAIAKEEGSVLMIAVAFIYSITSNLGKVAVLHSSPIFFGTAYPAVMAVALFPLLVLVPGGGGVKQAFSRPVLFASIGLSNVLMFITHNLAIQLIEVPYMLSVKRTSLIFGVLYGWLLFKEANIRERLLGAVVMLAGVVLIAIF
ncbi:MAG: EamA family transporter [Planctomycetes bacterium]|nr:EamA family transporter [Planctomycetota bacterium]